MSVDLLPCPLGFEFNITSGVCMCSKELAHIASECSVDNRKIIISENGRNWLRIHNEAAYCILNIIFGAPLTTAILVPSVLILMLPTASVLSIAQVFSVEAVHLVSVWLLEALDVSTVPIILMLL